LINEFQLIEINATIQNIKIQASIFKNISALTFYQVQTVNYLFKMKNIERKH
jgi:hypothetical protein